MSAFKVYQGKWTIEQAIDEDIARDERKQKAMEICKKHKDINLALACLLLKEEMTPDEFYKKQKEREQKKIEKELQKKQRMQEDAKQENAFEKLTKYCDEKTPLVLAKYGGEFQKGYIKDFTPYEFTFVIENKTKLIHRLSIKYLFEEQYFASLKKWIMTDKSIQKKKLKPSYKPDGRYVIPDSVLQEGAEIMLVLHEGEMVRGKILWYTPYDLYLAAMKNEIFLMRHSVIECALLRRPPKKS